MAEIEVELGRARAATARVLRTASAMPPDAFGGPSLLPGWTRAHVLAHLARNADSHLRMLDGQPQYPSREVRAADIEAGARQAPTALLEDLRAACARLEERWRGTSDWDAEIRTGERTTAARKLVRGRYREVEIHHVDLAAGYRPEDWPDGFAEWTLNQAARSMAADAEAPRMTLTADDGGGPWRTGEPANLEVSGPARALCAWLIGRSTGDGLTVRPEGPLPTPPPWP